jgi:tripartite-type tricarboxylate transporter receptor subunit TctC
MRRLLCCLLIPFAAAAAGAALAQAWPSKPVTLVVPFPPGGSSDQVARALGQKLNAALGQTFIVETRPAPQVPSAPPRSSARRQTATPFWSPRSGRW